MQVFGLSRIRFAGVLSLELAAVVAAVELREHNALTPHLFLIVLVLLLVSPLLLCLNWLKARKILGLSFLTSLCGFAVVGDSVMHKVYPALAFGVILLLCLFRIWRDLREDTGGLH